MRAARNRKCGTANHAVHLVYLRKSSALLLVPMKRNRKGMKPSTQCKPMVFSIDSKRNRLNGTTNSTTIAPRCAIMPPERSNLKKTHGVIR
ncbi:hypothetical protein D3C81_1900030 [compost metagenome]